MDDLVATAQGMVGSPWLLLVVVLVTVADCFFPPAPSDEVIIAACALAVSSHAPDVVVEIGVAALVGAVIGDVLLFVVGAALGRDRLRRWPRVIRWLEAADRQLERRGPSIIVVARFLPVVRIGIVVVAGGSMRLRRWLPYGLLACLLWTVVTVGIGALAGFGFSDRPVTAMVVGTAVGVIGALLVGRLGQRGDHASTNTSTAPTR